MALTGREMRPCWPQKVAVCNMSFSAIETGKRIRKYRNARNMKQFDLGEQVNVSRNYICKLEKGERVAAIEIYVALAEYFGVTLDELLLGIKPENETETKVNQYKAFLKAKLSAVVDLLQVIIDSL